MMIDRLKEIKDRTVIVIKNIQLVLGMKVRYDLDHVDILTQYGRGISVDKECPQFILVEDINGVYRYKDNDETLQVLEILYVKDKKKIRDRVCSYVNRNNEYIQSKITLDTKNKKNSRVMFDIEREGISVADFIIKNIIKMGVDIEVLNITFDGCMIKYNARDHNKMCNILNLLGADIDKVERVVHE